MKKVFLLLSFFCFICANNLMAQSKTKEITIKTSIICDHCKECETCKPLIETVLLDTKGIKRTSLDISKKSITVVYNPQKITDNEIRNLISKAGYDADEVAADPAAYNKLDDC